MVVVDQVRIEVVGERVEEAVEALEAAPERPLVVRSGGARLVDRREMPLADAHRVVAVGLQDLGERRRLLRDVAALARKAAVGVGEERHADAVVVAAGEQRRARRRAERRDVEVVVADALPGERVHRRRRDLGAVAAEAAEADVVVEDDDDVRRAGPRPLRVGPPRRRLLPGGADGALELGRRARRASADQPWREFARVVARSRTQRVHDGLERGIGGDVLA